MTKPTYQEFEDKFDEIMDEFQRKILLKTCEFFNITEEEGQKLKDEWLDSFTNVETDIGKMTNKEKKQLAKDFQEALADNEEDDAEMAAFAITCDEFGISEEQAYDLLAEFR